ncbi:MAG: hypothetical protein WCO86_20245 [Planctomycetota bacterium]
MDSTEQLRLPVAAGAADKNHAGRLELDLGLLVNENRSAKHCLVVTRRPTPTIDDSVKDEHRAPSSGLSATFSPCEGAKGRL